jgi:hypothetical protein
MADHAGNLVAGGWHAQRAQRVVREIVAAPTHESAASGGLPVRATQSHPVRAIRGGPNRIGSPRLAAAREGIDGEVRT